MLIPKFFNLVFADGTTDRFNKPRIDGNTFINSKALAFKLTKDFGVDLVHGFL
jgi:hypothetical protein